MLQEDIEITRCSAHKNAKINNALQLVSLSLDYEGSSFEKQSYKEHRIWTLGTISLSTIEPIKM